MGRRPEVEQPAWFGKVDSILHEVDPGRLVFHHQGGRTGDVETANLYLNFVPLAEQEEWLSDWSEHGDKPWGAVEHLSPVSLDFFKQGEAWFTEYAAIYLGDRAYALEQDEYLRACERAKAKAKSRYAGDLAAAFSANGDIEHVGEWTGYYELCDRFFRGVNRAWRAWGGNAGWFPWLFDVGFGVPPGYQPTGNHWYMYETLQGTPEQLHQRPAWANPLYDAYRDTMQPLLVYLGGPLPRFTAIEPRYTAGETAERSIIAVWDGPGRRQFTARWTLEVGGRAVQSGSETYDLGPGDIEKLPLRFAVPPVGEQTEAVLRLAVFAPAGAAIAHDETKLTFFPPPARLPKRTARWGLYDPAGLAGDWLKLGLTARKVGLDEKLNDLDVLVIGPRALSSGDLPFDESDVKRGLRVLILEQELAGLERFGFRCQDVMPRYVFPRVKGHPVLAGLTADDFANWRGAGKLLPTTSAGMRLWPWAHGPHWANTGSVASVVIETPSAVGFTPLLDCEFDLAYTPLLWLRHGKGEVLWSQLDLMGRIGAEPAADRVARGLVGYLDGPQPPEQSKAEGFGPGDNAWLLEYLSEDGGAAPPRDGIRPSREQLDNFVEAGGTVFCLRTPDGLLRSFGLLTEESSAARVLPDEIGDDALVAGVGPQLLHWRSTQRGRIFVATGLPAGAKRLFGGWLLRLPTGKGQWVFWQLPNRIVLPGADDARVRRNLLRLDAQVRTNLGVCDARLVQQILSRQAHAPMVKVRLWQVRAKEGEPWRLCGADQDGVVSLTEASQAVTWIYSSRGREAATDFGGGMPLFRLTLRVNDTVLIDNGQYTLGVRSPLRPGWNRLEATGPTRGRANLCVQLSDPGDLRVVPTPEMPDWTPPAASIPKELRSDPLVVGNALYHSELRWEDDPYGFSAW
ncbi:MAG: hypothetical protein HYU66_27425 [Armatimonadetes bacterium]|nr:hypothetical protein [Armatimonadota bacterium]